MTKLPSHYEAAKQWAEEALRLLLPMSQDERYHWNATAPANQKHFNHQRVRYVCSIFPEYRTKFQAMGLRAS